MTRVDCLAWTFFVSPLFSDFLPHNFSAWVLKVLLIEINKKNYQDFEKSLKHILTRFYYLAWTFFLSPLFLDFLLHNFSISVWVLKSLLIEINQKVNRDFEKSLIYALTRFDSFAWKCSYLLYFRTHNFSVWIIKPLLIETNQPLFLRIQSERQVHHFARNLRRRFYGVEVAKYREDPRSETVLAARCLVSIKNNSVQCLIFWRWQECYVNLWYFYLASLSLIRHFVYRK